MSILPERLRWRDVRTTTAFRLTLMMGVIFLAALWATLGLNYLLTAKELTARSDLILAARAKSILAESPSTLPQRIRTEIANAAPGISYYALLDRSGVQVVGNIAVGGIVEPGHPLNLTELAGAHGPLRVLAVRMPTGETVILGRDISQIAGLRMRLMEILLTSGVGGTLLVVAASVMLSIPALRRVAEFDRASRSIAAGAFQRRMPIVGRKDELDRFAMTVNRMLDEIAYVIEQVKSTTDAIAHDLRTPLTRVRSALDRYRQTDVAAADRATIVDHALTDLDHVIERFAALLRISEIEASGRRAGFRNLNLSPLIVELVDLYTPLAEDRDVALAFSCEPEAFAFADRELLFEALGNLVDNAIKFARSRVAIALTQTPDRIVIEVRDDGPGIPEHARQAVMQRFYRIQGFTSMASPGIGLAVVGTILNLHGATLEFGDAEPGLIASVHFAQTGS